MGVARERGLAFTSMREGVMAGQAVYNRWTLAAYDVAVLRLTCNLVWRCPSAVMLDAYLRFVGRRHLEIGPGTGYFLDHAALPRSTELTLLDLNPTVLHASRARLAHLRPRVVRADALQPLPVEPQGFDSVALNFVLHCLPGEWEDKGAALGHAASSLRPGGRVFGSTILARGVPVTRSAEALMRFYNSRNIFSNSTDDVAGLRRQLDAHFDAHRITIRGCVALFEATKKIG